MTTSKRIEKQAAHHATKRATTLLATPLFLIYAYSQLPIDYF
jgi:hypothetical protein